LGPKKTTFVDRGEILKDYSGLFYLHFLYISVKLSQNRLMFLLCYWFSRKQRRYVVFVIWIVSEQRKLHVARLTCYQLSVSIPSQQVLSSRFTLVLFLLLADCTTARYDRLLASWCCASVYLPSVCNALAFWADPERHGVQRYRWTAGLKVVPLCS